MLVLWSGSRASWIFYDTDVNKIDLNIWAQKSL